MPRLQILHHKSYHPYLEKNKQRVREDEARARAEELAKEQKQLDTEAEARLGILRRRAGSPSFQAEDDNLPSTSSTRDKDGGSTLLERHRKEKAREEKREKKRRDRLDFDFPSETARRSGNGKGKERADGSERTERWESEGHVNLFADLERAGPSKPPPTLAEIAKAKKDRESDLLTMYLGRPDKETKPWYADRELKRVEDRETGEEAEERRERERRKDARSKNRHDPLTHISTLLSTSKPKPTSHHHRPSTLSTNPSDVRKAREQTERERALALLGGPKGAPARSSGSGIWNDMPSSVGGDRTWEDDWERQKAKAGNRFFSGASRSHNGRSWEV
ncbi:hypothetical protein I316_07986 [Kwoniella heveanensis BCC8398]|uniref:CBF1-interacting co-repressor CIR N-terminal domain-containing protein n=1 Tax=Kwoniella heveanensis BCC8398 TaxID=1296120 RepID=A0A1B9GH59_9TREE|nr:hypothetical protein I316_07986 [Kwoniella heveanensis BCC8398]